MLFRVILALLIALISGQCFAWTHGASAPLPPGLNRSGFNVQFPATSGQHEFIDVLNNSAFITPSGSGWSSAPTWNSGILDANGFPCTNAVNVSCPYSGANNPVQGTRSFSGNPGIPASANYGGVYCIQGVGSATLQLLSQVGASASWTKASNNSQTCAGFNGSSNNCTTSNVSGGGTPSSNLTFTIADDTWSGWCVAVTPSGLPFTINGSVELVFSSVDPNNNGHYVKAIHMYEIGDGADFAAGKMYRAAWKSQIVSLDPGFVRFLSYQSYTAVNNVEGAMRFTERPTPVNHPYAGTGSNFANLLPYGSPTTLATNSYSIAAVSGTPASMAHGESIGFVPAATGVGGTGLNNLTSIAKSGTTVTLGVSSNTVFTTGDTVVIKTASAGNSNLNLFYATSITVDSSTQIHFTFANAASLSPCASSCGLVAEAFLIKVGSGSDRISYPVYDTDGSTPWAVNTPDAPATNGVTADRFCFSKTLIGSTDGSGNPNYGAWFYCAFDNVPLEYQVALINELNAMSPAHPINGYFNLPAMGLVCSAYYSEPDCSSSVDFPANSVNVVMNGANGFAGLCAQCWAIFEYANETWNSGFKTTNYMGTLSAQPATVGKVGCGTGSIDGFAVLNAELVANDINNSGYTHGRVANTIGGWMWFPAVTNERAVGGVGAPFLLCQPAPVASVPITVLDFVNVAPYFEGFTVPSIESNLSTLAATWGSDVASFGFNSSQALTDLAAWTGPMTTDTTNGAETIANAETIIGTLATLIAPYGQKYVIGYEGWWDDNIVDFGFITSISCSSGTVTVNANATNYSSPMVIQNVSVAGYNGVFTTSGSAGTFTYTAPGGTCPVGTPAANFQGFFGLVQEQNDAFLLAAKNSSAWATDTVGFLNWSASTANVGMPGFFIQNDRRWGVTYPDTYGATNTEGGGNNPSWSAIGTANQGRAN